MHHSATPDHAAHDLVLVAAHAGRDSSADANAATALIASCTACAALHRDLVAIAAATRSLPRTAAAPRDFRLSEAQADGLRNGSWLRALLRPLASARSAARPLAAALTSAGIAGLVLAAFAPGLLGGAASGPTRDMNATSQQAAGGAPAPEVAGPSAGARGAAGAPTDADMVRADASPRLLASGDAGMEVALGGATPDVAGGAGKAAGDGRASSGTAATPAVQSGTSLLVAGSVGLLLVGLALFGLRFAARRIR